MEIVSASILAGGVGAGAWLADKLLSPSLDALGEHFRAFAGRRLTAIFGRAEQAVDQQKVEALPPGFALQFIQKASFSEDDPLITDMWASLLADAAEGVSSRHSIFVDILSQIGPLEAKFLDGIFNRNADYPLIRSAPADIRSALFESVTRSIDWTNSRNKAEAAEVVDHLMNFQFGWPVTVQFAKSYWSAGDGSGNTEWVNRASPSEDSFVTDALSRQKLIDHFEIDFTPGWASPKMNGFFMTMLGVQFVRSCRRVGGTI